MTPQEFQSDPERQRELAEALRNPVLQLALQVLELEVAPKAQNLTDLNPVVSAAKFNQVCGVNHILHGLKRLTAPYKPPVKITGRALLSEKPPED